MLFRLVSTLLLAQATSAFFFGGGGGCGCQQAPACAPPPPAPCSGGNIVQGYAAAPQGYAAAPQGYAAAPQGYAAAPQGYAAAPQGGFFPQPQGYAGVPQGFQPVPGQAQYQAPAPVGGYQAAPAPVAPAPEAPAQVQAGGAYQDTPVQVAQVAPAQEVVPTQVEVAAPPTDSAYQGEQEVVASLAREEPNYQNTGTNVIEVAQRASELGNQILGSQAAAAAAKVAEVVEEEEEPIKKKDEGKTTHKKTVKSPASSTTAASSTATEFPVGEEIVADTNEKEVDISELHLTDDPLCNSDDLRKVVIDNIDDQLNSSKRMIQLAAEAQFGGRFDVICANGDFSYVTNTELYCQETKGDISCYTYRQL
ncbi:unnamed protein product [Caenorhabditis sp. 36 PRJEB53466]|nr:unnamed protein product [Caenorhabditis sp. 36 PRJEB53466]